MSSADTAGMLTAVETTPPVSAATTCSAVCTPARSWASVVEAPRCGVTTTLRVAVEQRVVGDRLAREDVERGAGDLAGVERVLERGVVDELAARAVDHAHAVLHLRERLGVQPAARLGRLGQVDRDEVGLRVDVGAGLGLLDAQLAVALGAHERVVGDDAHAEAAGAGGDELADAAEPEHAEHLLVDLDAAELRALPLARGQRAVRLRDVAREREHQRHGVLRGRDDVRLRRVGDDDAALGGRLDVDVVDADAGAADHLQVVGAARSGPRSAAWPSGSGSRGSRRCARPSSSSDQSTPRSTSKRSRRRSTPESASFSLTRTLYCSRQDAHAAAGTPASRNTRWAAPTPAPCSTSWPSWSQHHLQARQRGQDVEGAEVAAVGDPDDLALELVLAAVGGDAELAQRARDLAAVDRLRQLDRRDDVGALVGVAEQLEPERGDAGARGAGEQRVAGEDVLDALRLDHVERDVEPEEQRRRPA